MKLTVYDMREDEARDFAEMAAERGVELVISSGRLTPETASLARGSKAVALVAASRIDEANARALSGAQCGVELRHKGKHFATIGRPGGRPACDCIDIIV